MPARVEIDPEFALAVACCRWNFAGGDGADIHALAEAVDWPRFVRMVDRHRVQALSWQCLDRSGVDLPPAIRDSLSARAQAIVEQNLRAVAECARLQDAFAKAGLELLFIKGLTLGALAYREPFLKMGWDIDLLVDAGRAAEAAEILADAGYLPTEPPAPADAGKISDWHRTHKESAWRKADGATSIDLHTKLANHGSLIPGVGVGSPRQMVALPGGPVLPTLEHDTLVAYLCVHGASSAWFRLKWVSDLAALLHRAGPDQMRRLYHHARAIGAGPSVAQAFLLCGRLFAIDLGGTLEGELSAVRVNRVLERVALRELGRIDEPTEVRLGTAIIRLSQLLLVEGAGNKVGEAWRQLGEMALRP